MGFWGSTGLWKILRSRPLVFFFQVDSGNIVPRAPWRGRGSWRFLKNQKYLGDEDLMFFYGSWVLLVVFSCFGLV